MPEDKQEKLVDVGEREGAEITLEENNGQTKAVAEEKVEEKIEVQEEKPIETKKEEIKEVKPEKVETKKDDLDSYSERVKKRIAKLTGQIRDAERQREEAISYAQLIKKEKESIESKLKKTDTRYISEFESRVKSSLDNAKIALKTAIDAGNVEAQVNAQQAIAELTLENARLNSLKANQEELPKKEVSITPQQSTTPIPDPKATEWAEKNTWFGSDSAMTYTAFDLHKKLVEEEGYDPKSDEYYAEIDKRIRLEFPHKFGKTESTTTENTSKPVQNVASAKRSAQTGRKKIVTLTPSQVAIAKRLGVPLEEYAKQLNAKEV